MEWSGIERQWTARFRELASRRWTRLSEKQLDATAGRRVALALSLQHVYCVSPAEADRVVTEWLGSQHDAADSP
jgi:hypothetical protein